ncbi:MAG: cytochrome c [Sphingomonadales bacterium]|nr:cytochrome c [Sphingomonadales bacterium]MBD3773305.1 cytochrome c [Paracoccaceae bacterium]
MKRILFLLSAACLATGVAARADAPPASPSPEDLVAMRKGGMDMSTAVLAGAGAIANGDGPLKALALPVRGLVNWADALPSTFPAGSGDVADSRAKPEIWSDWAGFTARAEEFRRATGAMQAAVAANDRDALVSALASTKAACKGCHDSYQIPPARRPGD